MLWWTYRVCTSLPLSRHRHTIPGQTHGRRQTCATAR